MSTIMLNKDLRPLHLQYPQKKSEASEDFEIFEQGEPEPSVEIVNTAYDWA